MWILREKISGKVVSEHILEGDPVCLGRDGANEIILRGEGVSRFHVEIRVSLDHVMVKDMDSANGVFINHSRIEKEEELRAGDTLLVGEHRLTLARRKKERDSLEKTMVEDQGRGLKARLREVSFPPDEPPEAKDETARLDPKILSERADERERSIPDQPFLKNLENDQSHVISSQKFTIGRDVECDLVIMSESVSRKHAKVVWRKGRHFLYDTESANGCWVNGMKTRGVALKSGDFLRLGEVNLQYVDPKNPPDPALSPPKTRQEIRGRKIGFLIAAAVAAALALVGLAVFVLKSS